MSKEKKQLKNWWLRIKLLFDSNKKKLMLFFICLFQVIIKSQSANYISNGSFEVLHNCNAPHITAIIKNWMAIDSATSFSGGYCGICNGGVPYPNGGFQYPRTGNASVISTFYCSASVCGPGGGRGYLKNRMKGNLIAGKTYCVKFYVNIQNQSPFGIDGFGAYFGDNTIDTITKCTIPLTYLTPQVQNTNGNVITDTLNWLPITGTFVATGIEKYCVLGNFKSHAATNTASLNPLYLPQEWSDVLLDDVSCIPIDLPAFAGADIFGIPGNTVYLGRPQDVGIDEACLWYNLSNTTTPIANAAGITLTVATTTQTYMVKQDICGIIKYDTVVVYASAVGLNEYVSSSEVENGIRVYPNPANSVINVEFLVFNKDAYKVEIINSLGEVLISEISKTKNLTLKTNNFNNGVYTLLIKTEVGTLSRKVVIER
ncbi:MAG: T9SS type A sorting domain-containing protein [Bacteroidetes bacterium]|nr:T9SS type A sorting domain-containing protein [Bacteroidota bacterium]